MTLRRTDRSLPIALLRARETVMAPVRVMLAQSGISRATDARDRRKSIVTITDAGRRVLTSHATESTAIAAALQERFGAEKLEDLLDLLEELTDAEV